MRCLQVSLRAFYASFGPDIGGHRTSRGHFRATICNPGEYIVMWGARFSIQIDWVKSGVTGPLVAENTASRTGAAWYPLRMLWISDKTHLFNFQNNCCIVFFNNWCPIFRWLRMTQPFTPVTLDQLAQCSDKAPVNERKSRTKARLNLIQEK